MRQNIVQSTTFLTLLGGGETNFEHLNQALKIAPILVAADGGADFALAGGHMPNAVIGDMDSISHAARTQIPKQNQHFIGEQDSTDFEKCLRHIQAPAILAVGFCGGRLDHQLAACSTLARFPDHRCILVSREDLCFLAPLDFSISLAVGTRFSLFPMGDVSGTSEGLKYPIDGLDFAPATRAGTSNEVTGPVRLRFSDRLMLVLMPIAHLEVALEALCDRSSSQRMKDVP